MVRQVEQFGLTHHRFLRMEAFSENGGLSGNGSPGGPIASSAGALRLPAPAKSGAFQYESQRPGNPERSATYQHGVLTTFSVNPKIVVDTNGDPTMILVTTAGKVGSTAARVITN